MTAPKVLQVLQDVAVERAFQNGKWGEQNHPDGTGLDCPSSGWLAASYRQDCQRAAEDGTLTWRHILREEYAEALAEDDPAKLRAELIQVAAVAAAWAEAIDRRPS